VNFTRITSKPQFYYGLFLLLLFPALLINLGAHHLFIHTDESRRALVALEMILSGNYFAPTLNGEFYYNKPPLYNWIIAASFKLFGSYSAFALRFPVVVAVFLYGWLIKQFVQAELGKPTAWLVAIATITSGRIFFYDSFLGLIDIAFSLIIFVNFMLFYFLGEKKQYFKLFAWTYFLCAVAYLMKGLPPLVFQFFTLIAWLIFKRDWKLLFHKYHFIGVLFFILPVGLYYFIYDSANPGSFEKIVSTLWSESSKRTVTDHGIGKSLLTMLNFPLENLYHFAPWTIFVVALFRKSTLKELWTNKFIRFCILVFALNIPVYWTSPGVHPRYLFMFVPLVFTVFIFALKLPQNTKLEKVLKWILGVILILVCFAPIGLYLFADTYGIANLELKLSICTFTLIGLTALYFQNFKINWLVLGCALLVLRISMNFVLLPNRDPRGRSLQQEAMEIAEITRGEDLYILQLNWVHDGTSFIIERERNEILQRVDEPVNSSAYYLLLDRRFDPDKYESIKKIQVVSAENMIHLVKLKDRADDY